MSNLDGGCIHTSTGYRLLRSLRPGQKLTLLPWGMKVKVLPSLPAGEVKPEA
jgi:hypothetical protein